MHIRPNVLPLLVGMFLTTPCAPVLAATPMVSAGQDHALALKRDGTVWAWGGVPGTSVAGRRGEEQDHGPVRVPGIADVVAVSAGGELSLALKGDGTVWQWGSLATDGAVLIQDLPVKVYGLTNVIAISAGYSHALALKSDGTLWSWGANEHGQLGNWQLTVSTVPVKVLGLPGVVAAVSAGHQCSTALLQDGTVWAWGSNEYGQVGGYPGVAHYSVARKVPGLAGVKSIDARFGHGLAMKSDGTVWGWGDNRSGQIGSGPSIVYTPVRVPGLSWPAQISTGGANTMSKDLISFKSGFGVSVMGDNHYGEFGIGNPGSLGVPYVSATPFQIKDLDHVTSISGGFLFNLATTNDGQVRAWGVNNYRQLGLGGGLVFANWPLPNFINIYNHTPEAPRADLNGDGRNDILWRNTGTGEVKAWLMNGTTSSSSTTLLPAGNGLWDVAGMGDLDGDGKADILWRNTSTGEVKVWLMNGTTKLSETSLLGSGNTSRTVVGMGDLNGDGKIDIVWRNATDNTFYAWLMNGAVKKGEANLLGPSNPTWSIAGMGDLDGDGLADILWRDLGTGQVTAWLKIGTPSAASVTVLPTGNFTSTIAGMGDLDADGKADIVWRNTSTGEVKAWLMNGSTKSSESSLLGAGYLAWNVAGMGDLNGDGMADIVWRNASTGEVQAWLMNGTAKSAEAILQPAGNASWNVVNK